MAANLQQMAGGQMMAQQQRRPQFNSNHIQQMVVSSLMSNTAAITGWQAGVQVNERMGRITNMYVAPSPNGFSLVNNSPC